MTTTNRTRAITDLSPGAHDSLRRAACSQAAENMRRAAEHFDLAAGHPDRVSLGDAQTQVKLIRDGLDALDALGYEEVS